MLGAYVTMPLLFVPLWATLAAAGALLLVQDGTQWVKITIFACCFVIVYAILIWLIYFQPCGDYLILHKKGFRLKITFKQRQVLFQELRAITFGLESPVFRALANLLALARPGQAAALRDLASAEMNLHYKDGSKVVFKGFLHRFESEDLQAFVNFLAERHAELSGSTETEPGATKDELRD